MPSTPSEARSDFFRESRSVIIHQRPIAGRTNEIGSMRELLRELKPAYGRTRLFQLVTTDAGNTSRDVAAVT